MQVVTTALVHRLEIASHESAKHEPLFVLFTRSTHCLVVGLLPTFAAASSHERNKKICNVWTMHVAHPMSCSHFLSLLPFMF